MQAAKMKQSETRYGGVAMAMKLVLPHKLIHKIASNAIYHITVTMTSTTVTVLYVSSNA